MRPVPAAAAILPVIMLRRRLLIVAVRGHSMEPTYRDGEQLLARRVPTTRRGDVVVLAPHAPPVNLQWLIKRVAGTAGDPVPACVAQARPELADVIIPPGYLAVLGDNLASSHDSRHQGLVRANRVRAVVLKPLTP